MAICAVAYVLHHPEQRKPTQPNVHQKPESDLKQFQVESAALIDPFRSHELHRAIYSCFCLLRHALLAANPSCRAIWAPDSCFARRFLAPQRKCTASAVCPLWPDPVWHGS